MKGAETRQWLAAILAADVAGYSRLMADDEHATIVALDTVRAVARQHVESNRGRVIDMAGDSVLAVFETASGATAAATAIQQSMATISAAVEQEKRVRLRIGLHVGDVIEKADGTVYGDGVNIAARLQGLAEPGGITVSDAICSAVRNRIKASFVDIGEQAIKNIPHPVRAYILQPAQPEPSTVPRVTDSDAVTAPAVGSASSPISARRGLRRILLVDDHALFREGLAELLRSVDQRVQIIHAGNAQAALARLGDAGGIDLVLLDLHMPGCSGLELLATFKSKLPAVPVVVLSADESPKSVLEALDQGAMGYIPKSTTWAVMTQVLRLVLAGGVYLPAAVLVASTSARLSMVDASHDAAAAGPDLTAQQIDVLRRLLLGVSHETICSELGVGEDDIEAALASLSAKTRTQALIEASRRGLQL